MSASLIITCALLFSDAADGAGVQTIASRVDAQIRQKIENEHAVPAERAADDEFLRRLSLDLIGRIPTPDEVRHFLDDTSAIKRERAIDQLLESEEHARHFARVWRALLMPEAEIEPVLHYFEPGLEAWLTERRHQNLGFDRVVRELLTEPIAGPNETPQMVLRDLKRPNPLAFIAAKDGDPAKLASASIRLFLGLRLECAQCHDHPFDDWTQKQFWNQAAFFAGIERRGRGPFAPLVEVTSRRTLPLMDSQETVAPLFLDSSGPQLTDEAQAPRVELARWITSAENPYFAPAIVNRVWSQLFGRGLVDPVDDFRSTNEATHPELLQLLAESFKATGFDLTRLHATLCRTEAYQRTSRQTDASQSRAELFARMPVRPLSGEQFFDSLALAIGYESIVERSPGEPDRDPVRQGVMALFAGAGSGDPQTSVAQALALMNGELIAGATMPQDSVRLRQVVKDSPEVPRQQIEALYLCALSRLPTEEEARTLNEYYDAGSEDEHAQRLGDIFWMLLNSAEFCWNH